MNAVTEQIHAAYRKMAKKAKYQPAAPSDGFGNIIGEIDFNEEQCKYARMWLREELSLDYNIGCPDYPDRPALIYAVEAARVICGICSDPKPRRVAIKLLRMAINELEKEGKIS